LQWQKLQQLIRNKYLAVYWYHKYFGLFTLEIFISIFKQNFEREFPV